MNLAQLFENAKQGTLCLEKAVFVKHNPHLPPSSKFSGSDLIESLGAQEVLLFDTLEEGWGHVFLGSTAYLAEGMQSCSDFEEFVINVSGW